MDLREYLFRERIGHGEFAKKIGIAPKSLWAILNGSDMKLSTALRIEDATNGRVTCRDLQSKDDLKESRVQRKQKAQKENTAENDQIENDEEPEV
jgi:DNA-binding transcriptional regulator YdaS (Cro superfamily)